jgi:hypothetical protein
LVTLATDKRQTCEGRVSRRYSLPRGWGKTYDVKLAASLLTTPVSSRHVPSTWSISAWPPSFLVMTKILVKVRQEYRRMVTYPECRPDHTSPAEYDGHWNWTRSAGTRDLHQKIATGSLPEVRKPVRSRVPQSCTISRARVVIMMRVIKSLIK